MLGGTDYRVESVEGCGGSSVVYRASYEDRLNHECRHYVLIKELFPYHPKGDIYRDASGEICCRGDGADIAREGFRQHQFLQYIWNILFRAVNSRWEKSWQDFGGQAEAVELKGNSRDNLKNTGGSGMFS